MKIGGVEVTSCEEFLVLPRPNGVDIPFQAHAVAINDEFDKMVPEPVAPMLQMKGGSRPDLKDRDYRMAVMRRDDARFAFMCIKSLEPSNIEWERVKLDEPNTWVLWGDDLRDDGKGLSEVEVNRVINLVMVANALDEAKIAEARKAFLQGQGE